MKNNITKLVEEHSYEKLIVYSPATVSSQIAFRDGLCVAYGLLYNDKWDEDLQGYAVELLYALRDRYPAEWNASWEYDALLGLACYITYRHEEHYEAYKRAFERCCSPPPRLMIEFARTCICPGPPPIPYERAINLVMEALKNAQYADGIGLLCNIYSTMGDEGKKEYWESILKNLKEKTNSPSIEPKFLMDEFFGK